MDGLHKTQQQTNSFPAKIFVWEWSQFNRLIFSLYQLQLVKDPGLTTADGVVFVPHQMWLSWNKDPSRTGELQHPNTHGLIQQDTQVGLKTLVIMALKETINCLTSWILTLNDRKGTSVYLRVTWIEL